MFTSNHFPPIKETSFAHVSRDILLNTFLSSESRHGRRKSRLLYKKISSSETYIFLVFYMLKKLLLTENKNSCLFVKGIKSCLNPKIFHSTINKIDSILYLKIFFFFWKSRLQIPSTKYLDFLRSIRLYFLRRKKKNMNFFLLWLLNFSQAVFRLWFWFSVVLLNIFQSSNATVPAVLNARM